MKSEKERSSFLRAVSMLAGSTAVAHLISALALPAATRLYTPTDFSSLAAFSAIVSVIGVAACLRFDIAVPMPKGATSAANLLFLSLLLALTISIAIAIGIWIFGRPLSTLLDGRLTEAQLLLVPVGVLALASYSALQGWFLRDNQFGTLAQAKIAQSSASAATQISFGWQGMAPAGLLLANIIYTGGSSLWLGWRLVRQSTRILRRLSLYRMRLMAKRYVEFPKYSTWEALANSASMQLPLILIAGWSVGPEAGFLLLAMQVMQAPMAVLGNAVGQVYLSRAASAYRAGELKTLTAEVVRKLLQVGVGPLIFVGVVAQEVFPLIFGPDWKRSGELISWMTPWFIAQFLASPISMALHVVGRQSTALWLQLFGLTVRVLAIWLSITFVPNLVAEAYAASGLVFYGVYFAVVTTVTRIGLNDLYTGGARLFATILIWLCAGAMISQIIRHPPL